MEGRGRCQFTLGRYAGYLANVSARSGSYTPTRGCWSVFSWSVYFVYAGRGAAVHALHVSCFHSSGNMRCDRVAQASFSGRFRAVPDARISETIQSPSSNRDCEFMPPVHQQPVPTHPIAIIGAGAVSDYHHVPGIRLDPRAELVAACDTNAESARAAQAGLGHRQRHDRLRADLRRSGRRCRDHRHAQLHARADRAGGRRQRQARDVREAAGPERRRSPRDVPRGCRDAGVVHMTAFTYRFAPSMRYLKHLVNARRAGRAAALSQPAVPRLAGDELGLAAVPRHRPAPATCST